VSAPRIAPGGRGDVGLFAWNFARVAGRVSKTNPPNLFLTLGRHPRLFRGWLRFASKLMPGGKLPRRESELVILRVATLTGCDYEREHHVRLGKRAGLSKDEIERVAEGPEAGGWSDRDLMLLETVDALHTARDLDDEQWRRLRSHLNERDTIELLMLAGHYEMLATTINTLRIETDRHR
jgi:AhpD family alkylhydroperoxidase